MINLFPLFPSITRWKTINKQTIRSVSRKFINQFQDGLTQLFYYVCHILFDFHLPNAVRFKKKKKNQESSKIHHGFLSLTNCFLFATLALLQPPRSKLTGWRKCKISMEKLSREEKCEKKTQNITKPKKLFNRLTCTRSIDRLVATDFEAIISVRVAFYI